MDRRRFSLPRALNVRRSLLAALALLPLAVGTTARGQSPTARLASTPAQGKPLYLRGIVLGAGGAPLPGTVVELWQCDVLGRYHHAGDATPQDENFQGYGRVTADGEGRYAFKTIRPVAYGGRPPHLHFKLAAPGGSTLTTQLYVRGDATDGDFVLAALSRDARARLVMTLTPLAGRESDALAAEFDFVLRV